MDFNFIIKNNNLLPIDKELFFQDAEVTFLDEEKDILDILVLIGMFSSRSQARKNWKGEFNIPDGFTILEDLGKKRQRVFILKPRE